MNTSICHLQTVVASLIVSTSADAGDGGLRFTDQALARGVNYTVHDGAFDGLGQFGCGVALCDLDGDGDDDIIATGTASGVIALFANDGTGHFTNATAAAGFGAFTKASGVLAADFDGDNDLDLFITRWVQSAMYFRNNGNLTFTNTTALVGLTGNAGAGAGCSAGDFDGDGDLDLAIANRTGSLSNMLRNRFYRNNGSGTFSEIAASLGVDDGGASFQCLLQDLDRDGDCDLYVSNDKGMIAISRNRYFRNELGAFVDEPENGACVAIDSMGVFAGDLDMNGFTDIYCTNVASGHALLLSDDALTYYSAAAKAGIEGEATGWGTVMFDPDNDGDQDIYACSMATAPDYLWINNGGFPLVDCARSCGVSDAFDSYCLATSDIDNDGDVDMLVQNYQQPLRLYVNQLPRANHAVRLRIIGSDMNTHAVGALVDIEISQGTILREVMAGSCYKSQSSYVVHAGIGESLTAARVTVRWPLRSGVRPLRVLTHVPTSFVLPVYLDDRLGDRAADGRVDPLDVAACESCATTAFTAQCAIFDFDGDCAITASDLEATRARLCDLDHDGAVTAADLSLLLAAWGSESLDLSGDGVVGAADLSLLLARW